MALNLKVKIHPVVLFQIVDAYERRNADSHRVIGTLLGKLKESQEKTNFKAKKREKNIKFFHFAGSLEKGVVEVTNCFCVPHKETHDQVEAEISYALDVYDLNRRVNSSENIIGE